jgi:hypothetical protein
MSLDLEDIAFTSGVTKATFSGTSTSGVLTVTNGSQAAKIDLTGDYLASTFATSSDGHGGTTVIDPPRAVTAHWFVAVAASMGGERAGSMAPADDGRLVGAAPRLARPGAAMA